MHGRQCGVIYLVDPGVHERQCGVICLVDPGVLIVSTC